MACQFSGIDHFADIAPRQRTFFVTRPTRTTVAADAGAHGGGTDRQGRIPQHRRGNAPRFTGRSGNSKQSRDFFELISQGYRFTGLPGTPRLRNRTRITSCVTGRNMSMAPTNQSRCCTAHTTRSCQSRPCAILPTVWAHERNWSNCPSMASSFFTVHQPESWNSLSAC